MTLGQCYDKVRKLLNYYSSDAVPLPAREGDLWPRAAALLDTAQREFARVRPHLKSHTLTQSKLPNLLPELSPFPVGAEPVVIHAPDAQAMTFSTDGPLEVRVTRLVGDSTAELALVSCPADTTAVYRVCFAESEGDGPVTITFSGGPAYVWDAAAFETRFEEESRIPPYGKYRWQPLPEDCVRVDGVSLRPTIGPVEPDFRGYTLRRAEIGLPWDFAGTAMLVYEAAPAAITDDTPEDTELDVDDASAEGMAWFAAAYLVSEENNSLFELFIGVYRSLLIGAYPSSEVRSQLNSLYRQRLRGLCR